MLSHPDTGLWMGRWVGGGAVEVGVAGGGSLWTVVADVAGRFVV